MNQTNDPNSITGENRNEQNENVFARVQDYTGQGYDLEGGVETDKIAEAHRNEVVHAVEKFFREKYKTEVIVHNLVGNIDGVTVFVESVGEPHFYTFAVVPIDVASNKVLTDKVWSQEGQVEGDIISGIYAMVYNTEIQNLDNYLKEFISKNPVVGRRDEAVKKVGGHGFSTPYYYINITDDAFEANLTEMYLTNPDWTREEWKKALTNVNLDPTLIFVTLQLFMKEPGTKPDNNIFKNIVSDVEKMDNLPPGSYSILLHDNRIGKRTGRAARENTLERGVPNEIIKN
ncbi:DUF1672 family protein [Sporolactobacillus sp. THM19-2]|jgi:hypothetical protein|uniref:DUF1672 family protein n=1 Tax=Sporolactobacillus sp. THM19-2 TaxID=2511171 RepID=UPI001022689C|nr:DUF1672 family protein [Sporolactobacillus sp. THM19-2]RYL94415.1 DUF1672 family protein [Sporolactobacillus sp. THM19-2]